MYTFIILIGILVGFVSLVILFQLPRLLSAMTEWFERQNKMSDTIDKKIK